MPILCTDQLSDNHLWAYSGVLLSSVWFPLESSAESPCGALFWPRHLGQTSGVPLQMYIFPHLVHSSWGSPATKTMNFLARRSDSCYRLGQISWFRNGSHAPRGRLLPKKNLFVTVSHPGPGRITTGHVIPITAVNFAYYNFKCAANAL
jgi:hypothetical protein